MRKTIIMLALSGHVLLAHAAGIEDANVVVRDDQIGHCGI